MSTHKCFLKFDWSMKSKSLGVTDLGTVVIVYPSDLQNPSSLVYQSTGIHPSASMTDSCQHLLGYLGMES